MDLSFLRALGPAIGRAPLREAIFTAAGAAAGLAALAATGWLVAPAAPVTGLLIAPFGATAVLVFAAPASPLAQPWAAIVGNTAAALIAIAVTHLVPEPLFAIPLAVGLAILVMALARATHPPAGAVALTIALAAANGTPVGLTFALVPVALGSALLVAIAALWARATGRRYPFRQFTDATANRTHDRPPPERLGLDEADLQRILARSRQTLNLGVEDLARLIAAAELQAAANRSTLHNVADIMSRDLVTTGPDTPLDTVAEIFIRHRFTSLPVVDADGRYVGVIFQIDLIHPRTPAATRAADIMQTTLPTTTADAPLADLLPHLAVNGTDAVPVLDGAAIIGIVTQTDLIAALAHDRATADLPPPGTPA